MSIISLRHRLHEPGVQAVWAQCLYAPTPEKLARLAGRYAADSSVHALGWMEAGAVRGVLLLREKATGRYEVLGIATDPACRGQGIGRALIREALRRLPCAMLTAETDGDAVGFYRSCGFAIASLGERYPGVIRYQCILGAPPKEEVPMPQAIDLTLLKLSPDQRAAAESALSLSPAPPFDEEGNVRPLHALADLLRRLPWLAAQYRSHGIGEDVLSDTLSDVVIWMNRCHAQTGAWGMRQYGWLNQHFSFRLFRLGRLQFMWQPSQVPARAFRAKDGEVVTLALDGARFTPAGEADGTNGHFAQDAWTATLAQGADHVSGYVVAPQGLATRRVVRLPLADWQPLLAPGDAVLDIHIPEGEPLTPAAVDASLARAPGFFADHLGQTDAAAFTCESWLLDWALPHIQPGSNVARFQQRFRCVPFAGSDRQTMERVYGFDQTAPSLHEGSSRLQRAVAGWYAQGNRCRDAYGYIPIVRTD